MLYVVVWVWMWSVFVCQRFWCNQQLPLPFLALPSETLLLRLLRLQNFFMWSNLFSVRQRVRHYNLVARCRHIFSAQRQVFQELKNRVVVTMLAELQATKTVTMSAQDLSKAGPQLS